MRSEVRILSGAVFHFGRALIILEVFCSGPAYTNTILIGCPKTRSAAIIDAPFDSADLLVQRAGELGLKVEMILLTHSHWDHIANAAELKRRLDVPVYIHAKDAPNLLVPGSDRLPMIRAVEGVKADHFFKDGERLKVGELEIEVLHTPGHSPGCVCFYLPKEGVLISGDTLFKGSFGNISFPTSEPEKMWDSLERLSKLPASTRVFPGHGEETTIGDEQWLTHARIHFS